MKIWRQLSSKVLFENPWWTYKLDQFEIPGDPRDGGRGGFAGEYHYVHTHGASLVIPLTDDGEILLVQQYRYLCRRASIELPCGGVKEGHSYLETARLELAEETGHRAGSLTALGEFNPYNGITTEICRVFLAEGLEPADGGPGDAEPDATEELELVRCTADEVDAMVRDQRIWDGMTMAAWLLARETVRRSLKGSSRSSRAPRGRGRP